MAGVLGLGSEGSQGLTQDMIDQLKQEEYEAYVEPIEKDLEEIDEEAIVIDEIEAKTLELLETIKPFDLYVSGGQTAFNQVYATTTGTSASFDAADTSSLSEGTLTVDVQQLATKDVYQSNKVSGASDVVMTTGQNETDSLVVEVDGETFTFATKDLTYDELAEEINTKSNGKLVGSVEQVGDDEFRLVIKSAETGLSNSLNITQNGVDLGYDDTANHTLTAQNMKASIDGIDYDVSSNTIVTQGGLNVTGVSLGESTITFQKDYTSLTDSMYQFTAQYNELVDLVNDAVYLDDSPVEDKSSLKMMMDGIKDIMFGSYGLDDEESLFNYGFTFDQNGYLIFDATTFSEAVAENPDDLEELFVGYAEKEGMGTQLKTYLDGLDGFEGILYTYEEDMAERKTTLEEEKEQAIASLDDKYYQMELQFASTTALITQMEAEFAGLQSMIEQSAS